ncbi:uncharacterized protein METZ01_LOCUS517399, partial [marine metagenome]
MTSNNYNLINYIDIINRWKIFIFFNVFSVSIIALLLSFLLPKTYRASAVMMPPITKSDLGAFSPLIDSPFGDLFSKTTDETMSMIAILKSRTVLANVVNQFSLLGFYEVEHIEQAIESLTDHLIVDLDDEGTIRVSVDVKTKWFHPDNEEENAKQLSADIANYFIIQLDHMNKKLQTEQASFNRIFIE